MELRAGIAFSRLIGFKRRWLLMLLVPVTVFGIISCKNSLPRNSYQTPVNTPALQSVQTYGYEIMKKYPHDRGAFTQGLVIDDGVMYEGTGLNGRSSLRRVELETGKVLKIRELSSQYFGEGITVLGDKIIQLTWQSGVGFVYDKNSFEVLREFKYSTEGWGITHDGKRLIMSDGTARLYFLDPETFSLTGQVAVHDGDKPVTRLNELEYIDGKIYANVWQTNRIAIIEPADGRVSIWIDLSGMLRTEDYTTSVDVLNGIAYDAVNKRMFVTGKLWPWLFEIKIISR